MQTKFFKAMQRTAQTAVLCDSLCLIEVDVWVTLQLIKRQLVQVDFPRLRMVNDKIRNGINGEILNLTQLLWTDVSSETLSIAYDATCKSLPYSRHLTQLQRVGSIEVYTGRHFHLNGIFQCVTLVVFLLTHKC